MDLTTYLALRQRVWDYNPGDVERAATVVPPTDATDLALRVAYVILNGGMSWRVADGVWRRLAPRLREAGTVGEAFRHPRKCDAINSIMANRTEHFAAFRAAWANGPTATVAWCASLPHVGAVTKFHLAKNLGVDCAKPDVWLVRVAHAADENVDDLCRRLAIESGDRVAVVDLVIWRACERRWWTPCLSTNLEPKRDDDSKQPLSPDEPVFDP